MRDIKIFSEFFNSLPKEKIKQLYQQFKEKAASENLTIYDEGGAPRIIDVMILPLVTTKQQRRFFHRVCFIVEGALKKLYRIYTKQSAARQLLPLGDDENRWLDYISQSKAQRYQSIFGRLDSNAAFQSPRWRDDFAFLEPNAVGVGGIHYIPAANRVIERVVISEFEKRYPKIKVLQQDDIRELLLEEFMVHARTLGIRLTNVVFIEDQQEPQGTDELRNIAEFLNSKGIFAAVTDPRHLYVKDNDVYYQDVKIDLIYRDCELRELIDMEKAGGNLDAMKKAFYNNRVISSIAGEFDHKSAWEVFLDLRFKRFFTKTEKAILRKYIPWTKLIWDRLTHDENENEIDLVKYIKENKDKLVIKPNRAYGGQDVTLGPSATQAEWERLLSRAVRESQSWVVQKFLHIDTEEFPVLAPNGQIEFKKLFYTTGIAVTPSGIGFLGRCSQEMVVNVSRGGGMVPIMLLA